MTKKRVEVFTAGCYVCDDTVKQVQELACSNCEVVSYDLNEKCKSNECENKAKEYNLERIPAVVVDGQLVDCCKNNEIDVKKLKAAGIGQ